jgi:hypothetical protein
MVLYLQILPFSTLKRLVCATADFPDKRFPRLPCQKSKRGKLVKIVSVRPVHSDGPWESGSMGVGAAMSTAGSGTSGLGSGFFEAVVENGRGMRRCPAVGQHFL